MRSESAKVLHALRQAAWHGAKFAERLSAGRLLWGPSLEVTARKKRDRV